MEAVLKDQIRDRRLIREVERERERLSKLPKVTEFYRSRRLKGNEFEAYTHDYEDRSRTFNSRDYSGVGRYTHDTPQLLSEYSKDTRHFVTLPRVTSQPNRYSYVGSCNLDHYSGFRNGEDRAVNDERFLAIYGSKYSDPLRKTAAERYGVSVGFKNYAGSYQAWVHEAEFYNSTRELKKPEEFSGEMGPIGWKERMFTPQQERFDVQDQVAAKERKKLPFTQLDKPGNPSYISAGGYYTMDLEAETPAEDVAREKRLASESPEEKLVAGPIEQLAEKATETEELEAAAAEPEQGAEEVLVAEEAETSPVEDTETEDTETERPSEDSVVSDSVFEEPATSDVREELSTEVNSGVDKVTEVVENLGSETSEVFEDQASEEVVTDKVRSEGAEVEEVPIETAVEEMSEVAGAVQQSVDEDTTIVAEEDTSEAVAE